MLILDTNVVSELMRPEPDSRVVAWVSQQQASSVYTTALTVADIAFGLMRMPDGRRRRDLDERFRHVIETAFGAGLRWAPSVKLSIGLSAGAYWAWYRDRAALTVSGAPLSEQLRLAALSGDCGVDWMVGKRTYLSADVNGQRRFSNEIDKREWTATVTAGLQLVF